MGSCALKLHEFNSRKNLAFVQFPISIANLLWGKAHEHTTHLTMVARKKPKFKSTIWNAPSSRKKATDQQESKLSKVIEKRDINPLIPYWELEPEAQDKHRRSQRDIPRDQLAWCTQYEASKQLNLLTFPRLHFVLKVTSSDGARKNWMDHNNVWWVTPVTEELCYWDKSFLRFSVQRKAQNSWSKIEHRQSYNGNHRRKRKNPSAGKDN